MKRLKGGMTLNTYAKAGVALYIKGGTVQRAVFSKRTYVMRPGGARVGGAVTAVQAAMRPADWKKRRTARNGVVTVRLARKLVLVVTPGKGRAAKRVASYELRVG